MNKLGTMVSGNGNEFKTDVLQSQDVEEIYNFLRGNCTTLGFSVQYGISAGGVQVYEFFRKGKMGKRDIKMLIEKYNIAEWHFSWAWATVNWVVCGERMTAKHIDLNPIETLSDAIKWQAAGL